MYTKHLLENLKSNKETVPEKRQGCVPDKISELNPARRAAHWLRQLAHAWWIVMLVFGLSLQCYQDAAESEPTPPSVAEKWNLFNSETVTPLTFGAGAFQRRDCADHELQSGVKVAMRGRRLIRSALELPSATSSARISFPIFCSPQHFTKTTPATDAWVLPTGFGRGSATPSAGPSLLEAIRVKWDSTGRMFSAPE